MARIRISSGVRFDVLHRDGFRCRYCGASGGGVRLEIDHVHPVSKGGTNAMSNLVTACKSCNRGKRAKLLTRTPQAAAQPTVHHDRHWFFGRRSGEKRTDNLALYWEVCGDPLSDSYTIDEASDRWLLRQWVKQQQKLGRCRAPIYWYVVGDVIKCEHMPTCPSNPQHHFLTYYTHPLDANGDPIRWVDLPVVDKGWVRGAVYSKGGFIQEATGWKPYPGQASIDVGELVRLAGMPAGAA